MHTQTGKQRRYLRSLAHNLRPLVQLGKDGLTANVVQQINQNLVAHELIKVKMPKLFSDERKAFAQTIAEETNADMIQIVGHILILYRPHPDEPKISLPRPR